MFPNPFRNFGSRDPLDEQIELARKYFHEQLKRKTVAQACDECFQVVSSRETAIRTGVVKAQRMFSEYFISAHFTEGSAERGKLIQEVNDTINLFRIGQEIHAKAITSLYAFFYASGLKAPAATKMLNKYLYALEQETSTKAENIHTALDTSFAKGFPASKNYIEGCFYTLTAASAFYKISLEAPKEHIEWLKNVLKKLDTDGKGLIDESIGLKAEILQREDTTSPRGKAAILRATA